LAVCIRSWGACSLLSSVSNDAAEYRARARKRAAAGTNTMPVTLPPPLPAPPVAAPGLHEPAASGSSAAPAGAAASDIETADDIVAATKKTFSTSETHVTLPSYHGHIKQRRGKLNLYLSLKISMHMYNTMASICEADHNCMSHIFKSEIQPHVFRKNLSVDAST